MTAKEARQITDTQNEILFADQIKEIELLINKAAELGQNNVFISKHNENNRLLYRFEKNGFNCESVTAGFYITW